MDELSSREMDVEAYFDDIIRRCRKTTASDSTKSEIRRLVCQGILSLSEDNDTTGDEQKALIFLDQLKQQKNRQKIAICMLRLISEKDLTWLNNKVWRPKLISLFDYEFEQDLYVDRKIDKKLLGHEKFDLLCNIVNDTERRLTDSIDLLTSFDQINTHRQNLMGIINSRVGRILIRPFLPSKIEALLGESYKRLEKYLLRRDDIGVLDAYSGAEEELTQFVTALSAKGSLYSMWLADGVGRKLQMLLNEDFRSNKAAQPAQLHVEAIDKKYPFHLAGSTINLNFRVVNLGPGYAYDTRLVTIADDAVKLLAEDVNMGRLSPGISQSLEIPCEAKEAKTSCELCIEAEWKDFDGTYHSEDFQFEVFGQKVDIEWDLVSKSDPYSLEAVSGEEDLVGRRDLLNRLISSCLAPAVGSSIVQGQKRVGKTSIAKALRSHLLGRNYIVIYVEGGDYVEPTARGTITRLGNRLCKELKSSDPKTAYISSPNFDEALSPLADFLDDVLNVINGRRIMFILDEFDQLPMELYTKGPLGNAFFLTMRSISSRRDIGFVLVGAERMAHIMDCQGEQLNKWSVISVDYFNRENDWADFSELVRRPVAGNIEYTNDALNVLHDVTSGNPYFTKLICRTVLDIAIKRRDCYITSREIKEGVKRTVEQADRNTFQHFWEDGILEPGNKGTEKSIRRRKILLALSDVLMRECPASGKSVGEHPIVKDVATVDTDLMEFVSRKVLVSDEDGKFDFKVPLFQQWLKGKGVTDIIATFSDLDAAMRERQQKEEARLRPSDIVDLVSKWGQYRGQAITEDKIRSWLEQFGDLKDQRAMFKILKGLRYYSNFFVREKMKEVDGIVRRNVIQKVENRRFKRSDILISYMDGPAKSGAHFARLYADEAKIYVENVVEKGKLDEVLKANDNLKGIVFVDDFVGTGQSASEYLTGLQSIIKEATVNRGLKVFFIVVIAYSEGWKNLEKSFEQIGLPIETHACEILDEKAMCFGGKSSVFPDPAEREFAKKVAVTYGKQIVRKNPLGYGDLQLAVVFERGCPNNSLPILWSESVTPKWMPLFKRD
ncbi:MAG: AAA family ATPase [Syntrophaceae bacterium]|nr:AAA family ATPase [Syntrophaceae bacterium]